MEVDRDTNGKTMDEKLKELQIKLWHKYKRAPDYLLQHFDIQTHMNYIKVNDPNSIDENILHINPVIFNYVPNPHYQAYTS